MAKNLAPASDPSDLPDLSTNERVDLACRRWKEAAGDLSQKKAARTHGVPSSNLQRRIEGKMNSTERGQSQQKLSPEEETAIANWIIRLHKWGWPPRVKQTRRMAEELLKAKNNSQKLGKN